MVVVDSKRELETGGRALVVGVGAGCLLNGQVAGNGSLVVKQVGGLNDRWQSVEKAVLTVGASSRCRRRRRVSMVAVGF